MNNNYEPSIKDTYNWTNIINYELIDSDNQLTILPKYRSV